MDLASALDFAGTKHHSVLTTIRRNGRPQLSNVMHKLFDDGLFRISVTADRAKFHNLRREPWAALHVTRDDFYAWVVIEGEADVSPVAEHRDDATVEELVRHYRSLLGEHPNWDEYRQAMVDDRRAVVRIKPIRAYGLLDA